MSRETNTTEVRFTKMATVQDLTGHARSYDIVRSIGANGGTLLTCSCGSHCCAHIKHLATVLAAAAEVRDTVRCPESTSVRLTARGCFVFGVTQRGVNHPW